MILSTDEGCQTSKHGTGSMISLRQPSLHGKSESRDRVNGGDELESLLEAPSHPLGIKPLGNQYLGTSEGNARTNIAVFQTLPDETLMILLEHLDHQCLRTLGSTSRFFFGFCHTDELWKPLLVQSLEDHPRPFEWLGTWRSTFLGLPKSKRAQVLCSNVFSDVLHRPFMCSQISLEKYASGIPKRNQIPRLPDLTCGEFEEGWSKTPFILTDVVPSWPVYGQWTLDSLLKGYSDVSFRAEAVDWPYSTYHQYLRDTVDESPLYLFDKSFAEKMNISVGKGTSAAYWKPDAFGPDLFEFLGEERPAHRWLIIGPERSGSTFHKDPNATSAWNAVIEGSKYWIMFPGSVSVPGVYASEDGGEVTSPLSIAEWLLGFHAEARALPECVEGVCNEGEILHVPSGWWHLVVNLQSGIALTQNFVPKYHLADALQFLKDKPDHVSGFRSGVEDPYNLFRQRLEAEEPELVREALDELERRAARRKRKWDSVLGGNSDEDEGARNGSGSGFTFGFGGGDDDDEIP